jgi:hypothetical protein
MAWLLTILLLALPTVCEAAIAWVSVTNSAADLTSQTSIATSVTVAAGSDRALAVCVVARGSAGGSAVSGVTFNGSEAFTLAKAQTFTSSATWRAELWYLVNPTVTTANVVVTWPGTTNNQVQGYSVHQLTGVSQTAPLDATSGAGAESATISSTITTVEDNALIIDCAITARETTITIGAGQTSRVNRLLASAGVQDKTVSSTTAKTPAGAEVMSWTIPSPERWAHAALSFAPATAAPPPDPPASATQATLRWTNGTDAVGVTSATIKRCTIVSPATSCTPVAALTTVPASNGSSGIYVDQTLVSGTSYNWCVANNDVAANQSTCTLATTGAAGGTIYRNTLGIKSWAGVADGADIGTDFDPGYTGWQAAKLVSGRVVPVLLNTDSIESYNAVTPADDQWCQITIGNVAGAVQAEQGCNLRMPAPATNNWYTAYASRNGGLTTEIVDFDGSPSTIASENTTAWAAGDKLRFEAQGTTLRVFRVVTVGSAVTETKLLETTSATHTSGRAGIASLVATGGVLTDNQIYDFAMGEFSSTPPVPPTIASATVSATGAVLTYGATTPTSIRVNAGNNTATILNIVEPISAFPGGVYTRTWLNGLTFVCFHAIDILGVETTLPTTVYQCKSLVGVVQPLDTTPPVVSNCKPTGDLPFGTTSTTMSCDLDKPAVCRYHDTDVAYADMTGTDMVTASLTCSVIISGLTNGSTTTKYVRAQSIDELDGAHPTTSSQAITIAVLSSAGADTTAPSNVSGLVATPLSNSQVNLTWTAATDAGGIAGYLIYLSTDACATFVLAGEPVAATTTVLNLQPSTAYCFGVKAIDTSNNISAVFLSFVSLTTSGFLDVQPPSTPGTLSATAITSTSLLLMIPNGTDDIGVTATTIERCTGLGCSDFRVLLTIAGSVSTLITDLQASTSYTFRVKYADAAGNPSAYSPLFTVISGSESATTISGYCRCHLHH